MVSYIIRRLLVMIPMIIILSIMLFMIVELPPGDYVTINQNQGKMMTAKEIENLEVRYGLDKPVYQRYLIWAGNILKGDLGYSQYYMRPVTEMIGARITLTIVISFSALIFSWIIAFPIGIYSAIRQYSFGDYFWTFIAFLGLSIPSFILALVMMYYSAKYVGADIGGLFSPEFINASWSVAKFMDFLKHLWIPMVIIGVGGSASLIRILRANLLDEIRKPYVDLARARGLKEINLILKYPLKIAINPFISSLTWLLPSLISGSIIVEIVLNLPTMGPIFLKAIKMQDTAMAGSFLIILGILTILSSLISDILLAWFDPRIKYS